MAIPVDVAAAALREAMRETVKRYSLWYLIQGVLLVVAGVLALIYPLFASVTVVFLLAWILIISGVLQGIGLIGASNVPHYWLQLISAVLAILIGVLLLRSPDGGLLVMTVLLIVYFMVEGIAKVIFALTIRPFPNWGWVLGSGVVGILLAFILWANMPLSSDWLLGLMLGVLLVCEGAALTYLAWRARNAPVVNPG
jgi:uncharacterized membrane protein HdeD (DUF308 family)